MTFRDLVESRSRMIATVEFTAIAGGTLDKVKQEWDRLAPLVDAVNVTDNPAAHAYSSNVSVAIALHNLGADVIMQVVCRDKNRLAIQADIAGASMHGVSTICALTGDDVTAGDEPEARRVFDLDGPQLISVATALSQGQFLSGRKVSEPRELLVGGVENPFAPPMQTRIKRARMKVDAGAKFLQLQIGYQPELLEEFMAGIVANGTAKDAAIIPTVILTKAARALSFMDDKVAGIYVPQAVIDRVANAEDQAEESYQLVRESAAHALSLPGVAGIHITYFRHDDTVARLVSDLQIGPLHQSLVKGIA
jgi:methylenetetrahydrofolate reductase (NADPH)